MARKKKIKIHPFVYKIIFNFILIICIGFGIYKIISISLIKSDYFKVKTVKIDTSLDFISKKETSMVIGKSIFEINIKDLERRLENKYPQVYDLRVNKLFPNQISIDASKRFPFAQTYLGKKVLTLDDTGVILSTITKEDNKIPLIIGLSSKKRFSLGNKLQGQDISIALGVIKRFSENNLLSSYTLKNVNVKNLSEIEFVLSNDLKIIIDRDEIDQKMTQLGIVLSQNKVDLAKTKYIDLRFNEPIIRNK